MGGAYLKAMLMELFQDIDVCNTIVNEYSCYEPIVCLSYRANLE